MSFDDHMVAIFQSYAKPGRWVVRKLIKITGKPSPFFMRSFVYLTGIAAAVETMLLWQQGDAFTAFCTLFVPIWLGFKALVAIERIERFIKDPSLDAFPLSEWDLRSIVWWSNWFMFIGVILFPFMVVAIVTAEPLDVMALRDFFAVMTAVSMTVFDGGRKKKQKGRVPQPVMSPT